MSQTEGWKEAFGQFLIRKIRNCSFPKATALTVTQVGLRSKRVLGRQLSESLAIEPDLAAKPESEEGVRPARVQGRATPRASGRREHRGLIRSVSLPSC